MSALLFSRRSALQAAATEGSASLVIAVQQAIATYEQALAACPYAATTHAT